MPTSPKYETKSWTVSQLCDACKQRPIGKDKVIIPEFQRRLVWQHERQRELIQSIKNGFPIGALLLHEGEEIDNKRQYYLIDGLQRTNSIRKYVENPNQFFDDQENIPDEFVSTISEKFDLDNKNDDEHVRKTLASWVRGRTGYNHVDGWDLFALVEHLISNLKSVDPPSQLGLMDDRVFRSSLASFLDRVKNESNIAETSIPIFIYKGNVSELPTIFEQLNSKGVTLSRY
jgi:hypothetical protein